VADEVEAAIEKERRQKREVLFPVRLDEAVMRTTSSLIDLSWSPQAALVSLPLRLCLIIHLRCFRQLTFAEIGKSLNLRESTAKSSFYRALSRLRRALAADTNLAAAS